MITEEERQSIIQEAVEKTLLMIPDVVGNLMMNQASLVKMNRAFYEKFPEFAGKKPLVASVIEQVEGSNPGLSYSEILDKAVPIITERIRTVGKLDTKSISRPSRRLDTLDIGLKSDHGDL